MRTRTLVAHRRYFGLDPVRLRSAAGRVLTRVVGLPPERAKVNLQNLRQDFALDTMQGQLVVRELVHGGLLRPLPERAGDFAITSRFREYAAARVVDPLPRARARVLLEQARHLAAEINAQWSRNPLEIEALAVSGSYMTRDDELSDLTLGLVVRSRAPERRARWGRMANKQGGATEIRAAFAALSSYVAVHFTIDLAALPRPFAVVFRAEPRRGDG